MPTPRETILTALNTLLLTLPATALRGEVLPERVPAAGLLILRDCEPGEPEVTLSPLRYHYQQRAEIEAVLLGADPDTTFNTLTASIAIKGRFKGQVMGGKVRLHASARVTGEITYESLSIESGAEVEGQCKPQPYTKDTKLVDQASGSAVE